MSPDSRGPVVIDTGVFSARLGRREGYLTPIYQSVLEADPRSSRS